MYPVRPTEGARRAQPVKFGWQEHSGPRREGGPSDLICFEFFSRSALHGSGEAEPKKKKKNGNEAQARVEDAHRRWEFRQERWHSSDAGGS